jgi:hypothetical protein
MNNGSLPEVRPDPCCVLLQGMLANRSEHDIKKLVPEFPRQGEIIMTIEIGQA